MKRKLEVRPQFISLKPLKRNYENQFKYSVYKILRFAFVSVWFYYFPFFVIVLSNVLPLAEYWMEK